MKLYHLMISEQIKGVGLYLIIMLAGIDYAGILDYGLKAALGSIVWFGFKLLGDYYSAKIKRSVNHQKKQQS